MFVNMPSDETNDPPSFQLKEPESSVDQDTIHMALLNADHFELVAVIVNQPPMTQEKWNNELSEVQKEELNHLCVEFLRVNKIVEADLINKAETGNHSNP